MLVRRTFVTVDHRRHQPLRRRLGLPWRSILLTTSTLAKVINRTVLLPWSFSPSFDPPLVSPHAGTPPP
jgi:hypothetical protein